MELAKLGAPEPIWFGETLVTFEWKIVHESSEHREKYSMGRGYYLKASGRYSSGWTVRKLRGRYLDEDAAKAEPGALVARA